jgi:thiamine kinase-like enzyme
MAHPPMPLARRLITEMSTKSSHYLGPGGFAKARLEGASFVLVENRPYIPSLIVDLKDEASVINAASIILSSIEEIKNDSETIKSIGNAPAGKVTKLCGGLTNALFQVDISSEQQSTTSSVLVRIFGAEGMIDRDKETANFARLCNSSKKGGSSVVVHSQLNYLGRFGNGRVETLIPNMRAATICDLQETEDLVLEVTRQMARLHYGFDIPNYLLEKEASSCEEGERNNFQPVLWDVLASWNEELMTKISRACSRDVRLVNIIYSALFGDATTPSLKFESSAEDDGGKNELMSHIAQQLTRETRWIKDYISEHLPNALIAFCHNDVNAANILLNDGLVESNCFNRESVAMIDYEYGAINYTMYDMANLICEHCGGNDNGIPNYGLLPPLELQRKLVQEYIRERDRVINATVTNSIDEKEVSTLLSQVQTFQMVSHLYWGTWGILQGATELLEGTYEIEIVKARLHGEIDTNCWDNLRYGKNRLDRYRKHKQSLLEKDQKQMSYLYHSGRL